MDNYVAHKTSTHTRTHMHAHTHAHHYSKYKSPSNPPPVQSRKGPPRPVIPYHVHQEGKRRLAESLVKQQRVSSGKDVPASVLRMLTTPPDTPQSSHSPDDHVEKASLDSRSSTEASASVSSGDVPTGNLVDVSVVGAYRSIPLDLCHFLPYFLLFVT